MIEEIRLVLEDSRMVLVNLQLKIKPEVRDEFITWFHSVLPGTRSYEGCSEVNACDLLGDENAVEVISRWESKAHYDKYLAWRGEDGTLDTLGKYLAADPVFRFLDVTLEL